MTGEEMTMVQLLHEVSMLTSRRAEFGLTPESQIELSDQSTAWFAPVRLKKTWAPACLEMSKRRMINRR
jgi:hypothetical protein